MRFSSFDSVVRPRVLTAAMMLAFLVLLAGCSRFEKDWRAAAVPSQTKSTSPAGRWQGTWKSDVNGHTDELRCLISSGKGDSFTARFHARYRRGLFRFSFQYSVPLHVERTSAGWKFSGDADLGWLAGGVYRYSGSVSNEQFHSTYDSRYDRGVFDMRRVESGRE